MLVEALFPTSKVPVLACQLQKHCVKGQQSSHTLLQLISSDAAMITLYMQKFRKKTFKFHKQLINIIKKHLNYIKINFRHCQLCKIGEGLEMGLAHARNRSSALL